jgi:hypothetical protein
MSIPKIRLKADCPLAKLNEIFPKGVPVGSTEPLLLVQNQPCLALFLRTPTARLHDELIDQVLAALQDDAVPVSITLTVAEAAIVPILPEWVESPEEEAHGLIQQFEAWNSLTAEQRTKTVLAANRLVALDSGPISFPLWLKLLNWRDSKCQ